MHHIAYREVTASEGLLGLRPSLRPPGDSFSPKLVAATEALVIALGVDPGTLRLGWGVVRREGNRLRHVAHGVVSLKAELDLAVRLCHIEEGLDRVLKLHRPDVGSVETLFFHRDAQAAAKLGHARGVVLLCLARRGISVVQYSPAKVKRTIAGHGRAGKPQVAKMVRALLALDAVPSSDAADALALAITHLRVGPLEEALAVRRAAAGDNARPEAGASRSAGRGRRRARPRAVGARTGGGQTAGNRRKR